MMRSPTFSYTALSSLMLWIVCAPPFVNGQGTPKTDEEWRRFWGPHEYSELPKGIVGDPGKLSLKVVSDDQANKAKLYVINDTQDEITLTSQDGDFCLKREVFVELDGWHRVQPHIFSDCGNSYGSAKLPSKQFFMREAPLHDGPDQPAAKVRYRFYTDAHRDIASPIITARVDKAWLRWCKCDAMSLRDAPVDVIGEVALKGSPELPQRLIDDSTFFLRDMLSPEGQEWVRMDAIMMLSRSKQVAEAARLLNQIVNLEAPKSRLWTSAAEGLCELQKESLDGWAHWLMQPEQQEREELLKLHLFRMGFAATRGAPWRFPSEFDEWIESLISKPSNPLSACALPVYACGLPHEKHHTKMIELWHASRPGIHKEQILEAVRRVAPHKVLGITQTSVDHQTMRIALSNISGLPIEFEMPSPGHVVSFCLIDDASGRVFPAKASMEKEPSQRKTIKLSVGEHLVLPDFNLNDLFDLPAEGDFSVSLRTRTNLPQFGELPAIPNGYNGLRVSKGKFRTLS